MKNGHLKSIWRLTLLCASVIMITTVAEAQEKDPEPATETKDYAPDTKVYCEALWMHVHAADCRQIFRKDKRKSMTLEQADKEGWRIGRNMFLAGRCCFEGYQRKHPVKEIGDDEIFAGGAPQRHKKHVPGCHRFWGAGIERRTKKEWIADGHTNICSHCIKRGPSVATISDDLWKNMRKGGKKFTPPADWKPMSFSPDTLPPKREVDLLVEEVISEGDGIQEFLFDDPVASVEHFKKMRFFFPVRQWLTYYQAYRATGDKRILDRLLASARHYNKLATDYPSAARSKAGGFEGASFMYSMAVWSRITLQLARKHPDQVKQEEIDEAETFLKTMIPMFRPVSDRILTEGVPPAAFNRWMNGVGTMAMATAALKDLQAIKGTADYQSDVDRFTKVVQAYVTYWFSKGHLCTKEEGKSYFSYPYNPKSNPRKTEGGCPMYKKPDDGGHYSHCMAGALLIHDAMPEVGVDDALMTAAANTVYLNSTSKVKIKVKSKKKGKKKKKKKKKKGKSKSMTVTPNYFQCPPALKANANANAGGKRFHEYKPGRAKLFFLEAFHDGVIDSLYPGTDPKKIASKHTSLDKRVATLHVHYLKALQKDRSLIYLGEKK